MSAHANAIATPAKRASIATTQRSVLQRQCACGNQTHGGAECPTCTDEKKLLQRKSADNFPGQVPAVIHDVLRSPGQPLDFATRAFMESRFGRDLSNVRVHADPQAAASAQAVNSLAYTVGRDVVFAPGQYAPHGNRGRRLLAHELTHVIQQGAAEYSGSRPDMSSTDDSSEQQADATAELVLNGRYPERLSARPAGTLQRKMNVAKPADKIPTPGGVGVVQTNAQTVKNYLTVMCPGGSVAVDGGTGAVSISTSFCSGGHAAAVGLGIAGSAVLGAGGAALGSKIGASIQSGSGGSGGLIGGIIGAGVGAVGGAVGGALLGKLFDKSPAERSATATGCGCICDIANSKNLWTILVDDARWPHTDFDDDDAADGKKPGGTGGIVTTPSPNSPKLWGAATASGKALDVDPWLVLGHELCGHGWLGNAGKHGPDEAAARGEGGHQETVARENLLRREHGIEQRGTFKEPNCGESYWRDKAAPGTVNWSSYHSICEKWRIDYNKKHGTKYSITDTIP